MTTFGESADDKHRSEPARSSPPAKTTPVTSVAVIGIGLRLPGGINSPEQLWAALLRGQDLITEVPPDRWDADEYYDPEPGVPGRSVSKWGAFIDDVAGFDAEFFGITEREATALDPQHRLLLESSWEAMEHAGFTPEVMRGSRTGVFVGLTHSDYQLVTADLHAMEEAYGYQGNIFSMASGRIAYTLGLRGPALTLDTACSSGLVALHMACRSLNDGETDMAFAGGAFVMLEPRKFLAGTAQGHLSPTGRCHAFDAGADGYVCGEASAVVLVKRLPDAIRDGDRILAVVRGTAANQDGHTVNISTPSLEAQTAVYRAALDAAGVDAESIGMVEAHGTGTSVGDSIEYASLAEVYGTKGPCAVASIKTNLGHAQSASGTLGLIKAVLAVRHGVVPPNLHFTRLPGELARIDTNLFVPEKVTNWPTDGQHPRRAAVSSYGVTGTNAHAVLEQGPDAPPVTAATDAAGTEPAAAAELIFPISSTSADELRRTAGLLADWVQTRDDVELSNLAYTLARRRAHRTVRTAVVASSRTHLAAALREVADGDTAYDAAIERDGRGPVWVFSGQGSQWPAMGAELLRTEPAFADTVARIEPVIAQECGFSVTQALSSPQVVVGIDRVQPALFTMQVAFAATLKTYGALPGAVIGHSLGEVAAAVVAGALSLEDGLRVICRRSRLMSRIADGSGAMASVGLPAKQVLSELAVRSIKDVVVAVVAAPDSTVISGAARTVRELVAAWEQRDVMAREIVVDVASHSPQVAPILDELKIALTDIVSMTPQVPFYSTSQFDPRDQPLCDSKYWVNNLRSMVRFSAAVRAALEDGHRVFAELAPHPLLTSALEQTARNLDMPLAALAVMRHEQTLPSGLRGFVADLHGVGAAIDFAVPYPHGQLVDAPLPSWTNRRLWLSGDVEQVPIHGGYSVSVHPLLGPHVHLQEEPERHVWQGEVGTATQPWLGDHRIGDVAVLPGAAYCEMALAAAGATLGEAAEVRDIRFEHALLLDEETTLGISATVASPGVVHLSVEGHTDGSRARLATATLQSANDEQPPAYDTSALLAEHPRSENGTELRTRLYQLGVEYGPSFAGLGAVHISEAMTGSVLAEVVLPREIRQQQDAYTVHPALLDACFQSVAAHPDVRALGQGVLALPSAVGRLRSFGAARNAHYCYTRVTRVDLSGVEADFDLLDHEGMVLLAVQGLRLGNKASLAGHRDRVLNERLLAIEWHRRQLKDLSQADAGDWLLISAAATDVLTTALADALKDYGAQSTVVNWPALDDFTATAERLRNHLRSRRFGGVVVVTELQTDVTDPSPLLGRQCVEHLVHITRELAESAVGSPRLHVVTRNAQTVLTTDAVNLEQAGLRGLLRVISTEYPHLHAGQIDLDDGTDAKRVAQQLLSGSDEDETAWRNGQWYTARIVGAPLTAEDRRNAIVSHDRDGIRLQIRTPGDLTTLEAVASERIPPGPGQIEVAVSASSVNFADVLLAMGMLPSFEGYQPQPGMDFAGVVIAIGPGVTEHHVGDHVGGVADGCWRTFVTCDATLAVTLPAELTDHQAASITTAHATAWYGLHDLAQIDAGDKVLIHSAMGGVGQAAISIAHAAGAEIFATAGSPERRKMLRDMGIEHVYDSRGTEFAEEIRRDTNGEGVDIVLNSATGAAQRAGIESLSFGGRFVEIGKRDIYGDSRLGLFPFRRNLTFYGLDLALMSQTHPRRVRRLLEKVYGLVANGELPLPDSTSYPMADAATAIRTMAGAQHTGKLVLDIPREAPSTVPVLPEQVPVFRHDGAYIVTGGLGGLGLFLAEKMAAAECGRIVLASRSQPSSDVIDAVKRIRAMGADVVVECGDIADVDTAARLVATATATGLPLRGALHLAAVVEDATLSNITDEIIERDWAPKVHGVWNMHGATVDHPLDWFCSFSSVAALVGSPGQGAYAAANSWLDAFMSWRRRQGLPATTIAWGPWADVGRATAVAASAEVAIRPDDGAYAFETLLRYNRGYVGYAPTTETPWLIAFAERSPFAEAFRRTARNSGSASSLLDELRQLPQDEWPTRLRRLLSDQVSLILRRSVDPDRPLAEYGVDSLGALELRTRVEAETGIRLTSSDIASTSLRNLAVLLGKTLGAEETS